MRSLIQNLKTNNAHRPYMMLGTAASNSTMKDKGVIDPMRELSP